MDLFEHAERYPQAPGYRRTDTSKAAADSVKPSSELLRNRVLECLAHFKHLTADECAFYLDADRLSIRPRFSELRELGKIEDTGDRRRNGSGRKAIVWRLAHKH